MEIVWPDSVAFSVPAFKLHWVVVYNETFLMMAIPLRAWRKPAAFFIAGKGLGLSTMYSTRISLPGSCYGSARFFFKLSSCPCVWAFWPGYWSYGDPMAEATVFRQTDSRLCTAKYGGRVP